MAVGALHGYLACVWVLVLWIEESLATHFKGSFGYRLRDANVTASYSKPSLMACLTKCEIVQGCSSVSWHLQTFECLLSPIFIYHGVTIADYTDYSPPWISYWKHIRVWHQQGPNGYYSMTFEEAGVVCEGANGRLATTSEVLEARASGFEACYCSWMSNERNGFVLQSIDLYCWGTFTTDIIYCDYETANAFCIEV